MSQLIRTDVKSVAVVWRLVGVLGGDGPGKTGNYIIRCGYDCIILDKIHAPHLHSEHIQIYTHKQTPSLVVKPSYKYGVCSCRFSYIQVTHVSHSFSYL